MRHTLPMFFFVKSLSMVPLQMVRQMFSQNIGFVRVGLRDMAQIDTTIFREMLQEPFENG